MKMKMKMKNILFLSIIIGILAGACTRTFKLHTTSFDYFDQSAKDTFGIKKFNQGIYLFPLWTGNKMVDGINFSWFDPEKNNVDTSGPVEYAYLVFLDKYRVYYYSSFREETVKNRKAFGTICVQDACKLDRAPNFVSFSLQNELPDSDLLPDLHKKLVINQKGAIYRMRGYYKFSSEIRKTKAKKDTIIHYLDMDLEPPSTGKRKRFYQDEKKAWTDNEKKFKKKKVKFRFRLSKDHNTLYLDHFELPKPPNIAPRGTPRTLESDSLLAFKPTFTFGKTKFTLQYRDDDNNLHEIEDIQHAPDGNSIFYKLSNDIVIQESLKDDVHIMSW